VVTLTGPGGVGKTRLALQVAGQVLPRFGDGAWLVELAPIRDPGGVDAAVAAVFSLTAQAGQSTREALVELLRSKRLLLVLDTTASICWKRRRPWPRSSRAHASG
jgi:predicted ATPase